MTEKRVPSGVPTGGQFAASMKDEAGVALTRPVGAPTERLARVATALDALAAWNQHHSGTMLPHQSASDCGKCFNDSVTTPVREFMGDETLTDAERVEAVEAAVVEMTRDNEADLHGGPSMPHQSASGCRKCGRRSALRELSDALAG